MEGYKKVVLFVMTVFATVGTINFILPAFLPNFWTDTTNISSAYALGFTLGFAMALYWAVLLSRWSKF